MAQDKITDQFFNLDPNRILSHAESFGYSPTGEIHQLNSYENRVFEIKLENHQSLIAKYFRPYRWTKQTISDEHQFCFDLDQDGVSVGLPIKNSEGTTVFSDDQIFYGYYNKVRGRMMQEVLLNQFQHLGSVVARLHNTGEKRKALHRHEFGPSSENKWPVLDLLYDHVSVEVRNDYFDMADFVFNELDHQLDHNHYIRIHGDLHRGNLLDNGHNEITLVDFDDFINGPVIQDFWMIFPDQDFTHTNEFDLFLKGYEQLRHFDDNQLRLVPLLRSYRVINYAGWIMQRWNDPSFPKIFPEFNTYKYWAEETDSLRKIVSQF